MSKEYTYQDVAEHNTKKDIFVVIHDKVYDASKFIDEHPYVSTVSCASVQLVGFRANYVTSAVEKRFC